MNWRRGVLLATIQLVLAALVIARTESQYWPAIRSERTRVPVVVPPSATAEEAMGANFFPCDEGGIIDRAAPPGELVVGAANAPAVLLVGWHEPCAQPTALDQLVEKRYGRTRRAEILIVIIQCFAFVMLWLVVGALPLVQPQRWWLEPGAFVTTITIPAGLASLLIPDGWALQVPVVDAAAMALGWVLILTWTGWLGLLIWKTSRFALQSVFVDRWKEAR